MANGTLRDLWARELEDLYSTEQKIITALPELISAATSPDLKTALSEHLQQTKIHVERLDLLCKQAGISLAGATRPSGLESTLRSGSDLVRTMTTTTQLRDAAIISAAQHVEHYEMAGYGCARTWARQLDEMPAADLLQQTLDEEGEADKRLTDLAQSGINESAGAGLRDASAHPQRSHLRYVDLNELTAADQYHNAKIRNTAGDDLGSLDGFLVDPSGRPYYLVVDSRGLFVGRRYIVPIGRAEFRRGEQMFTVNLDKDTFERYPEFHRDAFMSMDDEAARRYEWRVWEAIDPQGARSSTRDWNYDRLPDYREPAWFDRSLTAARQRPTASSAGSSGSRQIPAEHNTRERVVAHEDPGTAGTPRSNAERVRGLGSDED